MEHADPNPYSTWQQPRRVTGHVTASVDVIIRQDLSHLILLVHTHRVIHSGIVKLPKCQLLHTAVYRYPLITTAQSAFRFTVLIKHHSYLYGKYSAMWQLLLKTTIRTQIATATNIASYLFIQQSMFIARIVFANPGLMKGSFQSTNRFVDAFKSISHYWPVYSSFYNDKECQLNHNLITPDTLYISLPIIPMLL